MATVAGPTCLPSRVLRFVGDRGRELALWAVWRRRWCRIMRTGDGMAEDLGRKTLGPGAEWPRTWDGCFGVVDRSGCHSCAGVGMEQAERVRGCSLLGSQKRGSPGRLTANASLLATPSARLTVVERTPSCPCHVQKASGQGPVLPDASRSPLPAQALARTLFCQSRFRAPPASFSACSMSFLVPFFFPQCESGQRATPA